MADPDSILKNLLTDLVKELPTFPDGRINYANAKKAPGIACIVRCNGKILLLKRSEKVAFSKRKWFVVAGFLDEFKPIKEKALEELREELGITDKAIGNIALFDPWEYHDTIAGRTWIQFPVLVDLQEMPSLTLDWEHTEYTWIFPHEVERFDTPASLPGTMKRLFPGYW